MSDENEYVPYGRLLEFLASILFVGILFAVLSGPYRSSAAEECPPYWQCTPKGDWNHPNCKCWDSK